MLLVTGRTIVVELMADNGCVVAPNQRFRRLRLTLRISASICGQRLGLGGLSFRNLLRGIGLSGGGCSLLSPILCTLPWDWRQ